MNRLDAMILRMTAQRAALDWAMAQVADRPGDALEVGLGNGRTYDHMREHMPGRRIWVIERNLRPHPSCTPPQSDLLLGDAGDGLEKLAGAGLALVNYDLGAMDPLAHDERAARFAPLMRAAMAPRGAFIVSTQRLPESDGLALRPETASVGKDRVFIFESAT